MLIMSLFVILTAVALPSISATPALLTRSTVLTLVAAAMLVANVLFSPALGSGAALYNGLLQASPIALTIEVILLVAGAIAITPWAPSTLSLKARPGVIMTTLPTLSTYPLFVLFTLTGGSLLLSSADFITIYLAVELQSFAVYVIAALYRDSERATHAGLLYFMLGGLSSTLILLGSALVYASTGHTSIDSVMTMLTTVGPGMDMVTLGFVIMTSGFLFKVTAAPFHNWGPDVYDGVPTIITTWLAVLPKISLMALLLELSIGLGGKLVFTLGGLTVDAWTSLILVSSLLSLVVGTVVGLAQSRIKRLLAYSTVSHVGFLLLALAVHSQEGTEAFIFYLGQYTATALAAFLTLLALGYALSASRSELVQGTDVGLVRELAGVFTAQPLLGASLAVCLFSMAGVPPLIGFFAKQSVLYTAVSGGYVFMAIVAVVVSVISASYYLRVVRVVHFDATAEVVKPVAPISAVHSYVLALLTLSQTLFIADPDLIFDSVRLVALAVYST